MKKTCLYISLVAMFMLALGCANTHKIKSLSVGMSKDEVILRLGKPTSSTQKGGVEYLTYNLYESDDDAYKNKTTPYYVRLVNGSLDSYGRLNSKAKKRIKDLHTGEDYASGEAIKGSNVLDDLLKIQELREKGTITEEEFIKLKTKAIEKY